jgi:hypothetical protein
LSVVSPAAAQTDSWETIQALPRGTNVQLLLTAGESLRGQLESVSEEAAVLTLKRGQRMLERQHIARISVKKPSHRGRNALIGAAIGGGTGLGVGASVAAAQGASPTDSWRGWNLLNILGPAGAILGLAVGAVIPTGGWRVVYGLR